MNAVLILALTMFHSQKGLEPAQLKLFTVAVATETLWPKKGPLCELRLGVPYDQQPSNRTPQSPAEVQAAVLGCTQYFYAVLSFMLSIYPIMSKA